MNIIDKLKQDLQYNEANPLFAPFDDDILGERFPGRFERYGVEEGKKYNRIFFDNGHNYTFLIDENMLYECDPISSDYFIHKHLEKCIYDAIAENSNEKSPMIACMEDEVVSRENSVVLVRAVINRDLRVVSVTNIFVQMDKRHRGIGKSLLSKMFSKCKSLGYRLILTEMVESFYNRMVSRGAKIIEIGNVVEITDTTNLSVR